MSKRGLVDAKAAGVTPMTRTVSPASAGVLQRKCACGQHAVGGECAECRKKQEGAALQRKPADADRDVDTVPPIVYDVLRGSGRPLDHETRAFMEPRFGHDFSGVRVHTGGRAAESARAVNALAYTVGRDVVFGEGQYVPGAGEGKRSKKARPGTILWK